MPTAIRAENISKAYQLGEIGTGTLSKDIERWVSKLRGKEDPLLKIGETNDRTTTGKSNIVWSLKDINFEIEQGEAVGIIGKNGAGKSTLLKILSRVTTPTSGIIKGKGRIASLLEVGTGFHPELTGRENIYLNGAILGMRKHEITSKFDEIVEFAGVERYIDTPVKRYSSGMYVRLAFAVAAHLESEILIIDEVLAVGDAEFQKKCLGKMGEISVGEGRTVLFVSHNMTAIQNLCKYSILLNKGSVELSGETNKIVSMYNDRPLNFNINIYNEKNIYIKNLRITGINKEGVITDYVISNHTVKFDMIIHSRKAIKDIYIGYGINDNMNVRLITPYSKHVGEKYSLKKGDNNISCTIRNFPLKPGCYQLEIYIGDGSIAYEYYNDNLGFEVFPNVEQTSISIPDNSQGHFIINQIWE